MTARFAGTLIAMFVQVIVSIATLALPALAHRDLLFGVPVPRGFRDCEAAHSALRTYRLTVAIPGAIGLLGIAILQNPWFNLAALLATTIASVLSFVAQNRKLKPFAIQPTAVRQAELGPPEELPAFVWLGIVPLAALAAAAMYLNAHWSQIPLRYPVHFDFNGAPDGWSDRSFRGVFGPLIFGGEFTALIFAMALAGWYGSRRSDSMRKPMVLVMLATETTIAIEFAMVPLRSTGLLALPLPLMVSGPFLLVIPALWYAFREYRKPRNPLDPTPNECWKGGILYYDPNDAALFVQRRDGLGHTANLGNRWSWVLFGSLLLVIATGPLVLRALPH